MGRLASWRSRLEGPSAASPSLEQFLVPPTTRRSTGRCQQLLEVEGPDSAVFRTSTLSRPLHLSGVAVADLWLTLDRDDAHVAVRLRAVDADGTPLADQPPVLWSRSAQHLDSIDRGFARQVDARPVTPGNPIRVRVRLHPTDLIVPAGAQLELEVSGSLHPSLATQPSGKATGVTIHHDCTRPSTLRFLVSHQIAPRPQDGADALQASPPASPGVREDGGSASAKVCGAEPLAPSAELPKKPPTRIASDRP